MGFFYNINSAQLNNQLSQLCVRRIRTFLHSYNYNWLNNERARTHPHSYSQLTFFSNCSYAQLQLAVFFKQHLYAQLKLADFLSSISMHSYSYTISLAIAGFTWRIPTVVHVYLIWRSFSSFGYVSIQYKGGRGGSEWKPHFFPSSLDDIEGTTTHHPTILPALLLLYY